MSETLRTYTGDGARVLYPIDFTLGYLRQEFVYVYEGEDYLTQLSYTWVNDGEIQLDSPVSNGTDFYIQRVVPRNELVNDYEDNAVMKKLNINDSYRQPLMIIEELADGYMTAEGVEWSLFGDLNMNGYKILNLTPGEDGTDGVNKDQLDAVENLFTIGAEDFIRDKFLDGVDFTAGSSSQLTLSEDPGSRENTWVYFDEVFQSPDNYIVQGKLVIFNSSIPGGTGVVEIRYSKAMPVAGIPDDSGRPVENHLEGSSIFLQTYPKGSYIRQFGSTSSVVVVPTDAVLDFPIGTEFTVYRFSEGDLLVNQTFPTVNIPTGASNAIARGRCVMIKKVNPDEWDAVGGFLLP